MILKFLLTKRKGDEVVSIEEMRKKLRENCEIESHFDCRPCPLREVAGDCFPEDEELLKRNYELVFGKLGGI